MLMTKIHLHLASKGDPGTSSTQSATSGNNILSIQNWMNTVFRLNFEWCIIEADILADSYWAGSLTTEIIMIPFTHAGPAQQNH